MDSLIIILVTALVVCGMAGTVIIIFAGLPLKQQPRDFENHKDCT